MSTVPSDAPVKPDSSHPDTRAIQSHLDWFFGSMLPPTEPDPSGCVRRITGQPHPFGNLAIVGPTVAPAAIESLLAPLTVDDFPAATVLAGGDDDAQAAPLTARGFFRAESMCLMSVTPDTLTPTSIPDTFRLVALGPGDDDRFADAFAPGYDVPRPLAAMFGPATFARLGVPGQYYGIEPADQPGGALASVSMCAVRDGIPGIYAVATRPEHRGLGLAAHLTAEPLRLAWKAGHTTGPLKGVLQSSAMGEPVYRRIGFRSHGHMAVYVRIPGMA